MRRRSSIEGQLAERRSSSVRSEISQLQAEERRRQAAAATAARARLAAQREAARISALIEPEVTGEADPGAWASGSDTPAFVPPPPDGSRASVIAIAMQYLGVPYVWGGSSPATGFDCSGFVCVFAQIGVGLPHHRRGAHGTAGVRREALQPGDFVFFNGLGHMGMYVGGGQFIHAPHRRRGEDLEHLRLLVRQYLGRRYRRVL